MTDASHRLNMSNSAEESQIEQHSEGGQPIPVEVSEELERITVKDSGNSSLGPGSVDKLEGDSNKEVTGDSELLPLGEFKLYGPPPERHADSATADIPPDFFEPTTSDLKSAQALLTARAKAYHEAPLLTEKLRSEKEQERHRRWPKATIRIKFASQFLLEKSFPSADKIKSIYVFVRACLREDARNHKFVLFETPPRRDLKVSDPSVKDKSLYELRLVPQSVLHFRFLEDDIKLDLPAGLPPLLPVILSRTVDQPAPPVQAEQPTVKQDSQRPSSTTSNSSSAVDSKISKFLRLSKGKK